jgi:hypothetical protein
MKALDLKHFKKVRTEADHTVMQHPEGHTIHIKHDSLKDHERKALHDLPHVKMSDVKHLNKGTKKPLEDAPEFSLENNSDAPAAEEPVQVDPNLGPADRAAQFVVQHPKAGLAPSQLGQMAATGQVDVPAPSNIAQDAPGQAQPMSLAPTPPPTPVSSSEPNVDQFGTKEYSDLTQKAMAEGEAGIRGMAKAEGELGHAKADIYGNAIKQEQSNMSSTQQHLQEIDADTKAFTKDVKDGHIDPQRYMSNLGTLGQISTVIGLALGGAPAAQLFGKLIDNDIKAQEKEMDNKHNLLSANLKKYGNVLDASNATRLQLGALTMDKLGQQIELMQDPMKKAAALQQLSEFHGKMAPIAQDLAARRALLGSQGSQAGATRTNPALAIRFAPGDTATKHEAMKELKVQQNLDSVGKAAIQDFDKIAKLNTVVNRAGSPIQSKNQIEAIWNPMIDKLTKENTGRVVPITVELMAAVKPSLLDSEETSNLKRQKFQELVFGGKRSTPAIDALGIKLPQLAEEKPQRPKVKTVK